MPGSSLGIASGGGYSATTVSYPPSSYPPPVHAASPYPSLGGVTGMDAMRHIMPGMATSSMPTAYSSYPPMAGMGAPGARVELTLLEFSGIRNVEPMGKQVRRVRCG